MAVAATLAPGWGGSWAGVGERVTDLGRRADGVASYEVRDVDTTERIRGEEVFEGAKDHCAADITASPKITNILERRSPLVLS